MEKIIFFILNKKNNLGKVIFTVAFLTMFTFININIIYAATSTNYLLNVQNENAGRATSNNSTNFSVGCSEFGKIGEGIVSSGLYSISAGLPCETPQMGINFRFAPEKRVPIPAPNLDMKNMQVSLRAVGSAPFTVPLAVSQVVLDTDVNGFSLLPAIITAPAGSYDVFIKSGAHLNQKYGTISFTGASTTIDFTQSLTNYARAGDVNGSQFGDDEVNAIDISLTILALGGSSYRPDTNQDSEVNALDIGILLANLNQVGE